jgi:hypothetical protein
LGKSITFQVVNFRQYRENPSSIFSLVKGEEFVKVWVKGITRSFTNSLSYQDRARERSVDEKHNEERARVRSLSRENLQKQKFYLLFAQFIHKFYTLKRRSFPFYYEEYILS